MVVHTYNPSTMERLMQRDQESEASWSTWDWLKEIKPNKIIVFPPSSCCRSSSCSFHLFVNKFSETLFTMRLSLWLVLRTSFTYVSLCLTTLLMHGCFSLLLKLFGVSLNCCCFSFVLTTSTLEIPGFVASILGLNSEQKNNSDRDLWAAIVAFSFRPPANWPTVLHFPNVACFIQLCHFISFKFPCSGIVSISQST